LPALLEIARATTRVRVGPSCLNPFTVHPVEIAGQIAALDAASDGRAFLGLARGAWLEELGVDQSEPVTAIREAWEIVRRLLAGDATGFAGERFSLPEGSRLRYERRRPSVPLLVGTWSPKLAAFAGDAAQELKVGGTANPEIVPVMRNRIGNDDVRVVLGAVTVVDEDGERARSIARREVAMYLDVVGKLDPTLDLDAERGGEISDDVLDRFAFAGTPEQVAAHAEAVFEAGAGRIDFGTPHGVPAQHGVELLCKQVLPRLL
jgi:5,10-methylenetetrahydromethanopterin reductase